MVFWEERDGDGGVVEMEETIDWCAIWKLCSPYGGSNRRELCVLSSDEDEEQNLIRLKC